MPRYTHRARSSSSSSSSSHSPAPKHRSRSPRNLSSGRYGSRRSPSRRSQSRSPRRRYSPSPRRRSPVRPDGRRRSPYRSRRSFSPRRRSPPKRFSPNRRSRSPKYRRSRSPEYRRSRSPNFGRSKSPGRRRSRSPGYRKSPARQRSTSPRGRFQGSSPSRVSRRSPPRQKPPIKEALRRSEPQRGPLSSSAPPYLAPTDSRRDSSRPEPSAGPDMRHTDRAAAAAIGLDTQRPEWIPGLDLEPEPAHAASGPSGKVGLTLFHSKSEALRHEHDSRDKNNLPANHMSYSHRHDSHGARQSDAARPAERGRSPVRSPVARRHEAERNYDWVHPRMESGRPAATAASDPVRVSVNMPHSPGEADPRRDRGTTAPWEHKRHEQEYRHADERRDTEARLRGAGGRPEQRPGDTMEGSRYFPTSAVTSSARGSLSQRFGAGTESERPFEPKENITVGIQRNLKDADEHAPIKRQFVEMEVALPRRKEEGETPLSLREEFKTRPEDEEEVEERRVVKVVKSDIGKPPSWELRKENFEVRREYLTKPPVTEQWKERESRVSETTSTFHRRPEEDKREVSDYRSREDARFTDDERHVVKHRPREEEHRRSPARHEHDERRVTDSGRRHGKTEGGTRREGGEHWMERKRERYEHDPHDLRHNLASKRRTSEKDDQTGWDARARSGERHDSWRSRSGERTEYPDFSKRADKYSYGEWKDRPEMIPKGSSYYEHDNRDTFVPRARGRGFRGRGRFFRGRGFTPFRGRFRGRGRGFVGGFTRRYNPVQEREWKHDKFNEIEENKEERPSSTTEK